VLRGASPHPAARRLRAGLAWLAVAGLAGLAFWTHAGVAQDSAAPDDEKTGGDTTVFATGQNAFSRGAR